jgi:hypothetical protein
LTTPSEPIINLTSVSEAPLSATEVERFILRGFVRLEEAFPRTLADECRASLWNEIGLSPDDPSGWTSPVIRLETPKAEIFDRAAQSPRLFAAYDQLVGIGSWKPPPHMGGSTVIRFPVEGAPGDDGWHHDSGFKGVQPTVGDRALLVLVLFSDVTVNDAPTRIRVGSHLDLPTALKHAEATGVPYWEDMSVMHEREIAAATGEPGDVYLCHPFLLHAGDRNRGRNVRFLAQPGVFFERPFDLTVSVNPMPVEAAIRIGLGTL